MGMIYSALCMISFCCERVLTWTCCACALITLLSAIMLLMIYGISIGYGYAQQELAGFAKKSREHLTNVSLNDLSKSPEFPPTPLRRRRRARANATSSAEEYQPNVLRADDYRISMDRSYPLYEIQPNRNHRNIGVPRKAPDDSGAPDVTPEVQNDPKAPYVRGASEVKEAPYVQEASYSRKTSVAQNAPYAQETPDIQVATYSRQASDTQEASNAQESPYAQEASDPQQASVVQEAVDAREIPDSQEALDARNAPYSRESPAAQESPNAHEPPDAVKTPDARYAPIAQGILDTREIPDSYAYSRTKPSPIIILPTERPPVEPEMLPHEKELARKIIGRVRRSKISRHLTV